MATIITRKDCTLSEANAYYRIESKNLSRRPTVTGIYYNALSTARVVPVTFDNPGNFKGGVFTLYSTATGNRNFTVDFQNGRTATLPVASPGVVTLTGHGLAVDTPVQFTTAGTLPTGVTAGTTYYVLRPRQSPVNMTNDSSPSPFVASASGYYSTNNPYKAFDGTTTTARLMNTTGACRLKLDYGATTNYAITKYSLYPYTSPLRAPKNRTFEGSNDDSTRTVLDTRSGITFASSTTQYFEFTNTTTYRYYRINITANGGDATYTGIFGMEMYGLTADTFALAAAPATQTPINFTGTSSGTHTCWNTVATQTKSFDTIRGNFTSNYGAKAQDKLGIYITNMDSFSASPAVTTAANTWRFRCYQSGGTTGTLNLWLGADQTTYSYAAYCDTQVSYSSGDTVFRAHYCDIDQSAAFNSILGAGDTTVGCAGVICSNERAQDVANVAFLRCLTPAASYTLTLRGTIVMAGHSGFRAGTSAVPIPVANKLIVNFDAPTVGTTRGYFYVPTSRYTATYYSASRSSVFCYGAYPAKIATTLTADTTNTGNIGKAVTMTIANPCVVTLASHGYTGGEAVVFTTTGSLPSGGTTTLVPGTTYYVKYVNTTTFRLAATPGGADISTLGGTQSGTHYLGTFGQITVAEDMSLQGRGVGDPLSIGRQDVALQGDLNTPTIRSISGTTITLDYAIPIYNRLTGGHVINLNPAKYGINFVDLGSNTLGGFSLQTANNLNFEGCYFLGTIISGVGTRVNDDDADANIQLQTFKNNVSYGNGTARYYTIYNVRLPRLGLTVDNCRGHYAAPYYGVFPATATATYKSGTFTANNVGVNCKYSAYFGINSKCKVNITNHWIDNTIVDLNYSFVMNVGAGSVIDNINIFRHNNTTTAYPAIGIGGTSINSSISNVTLDKCGIAFQFLATAFAIGLIFDNMVITNSVLYDITFLDGGYANVVFKNCNGFERWSVLDLTNTIDGTNLSFSNYNDVANADSSRTTYGIFTRTGTGLSDTTVHTVGTGKYAIKFENTLYGNPLERSVKVPTGDIQNKTAVVSVWCKIASSRYWTATNNMPKLTIYYDDDVSNAYAEAAQTTDRQLLFVPISPTTTFGEITMKITTDSNAGDRGYVTASTGTPTIITYAGHGFTGGEKISFSSDDTLPTGILGTVNYFVNYIDVDTFNISLYVGGPLVATTDSGTGNLSLRCYKDTDVYFDDVSVFYPPGVSLNLGGLDLWSAGYPIVPPISTSINPSDVRAYQASLAATVQGSVGEMISSASIRLNTVASATSLSLVLDSGASAIDDYYNENYVVIVSGPGAGQARRIVNYDGATKTVTINRAWETLPTALSRYNIIPFFSVENAIRDAATTSHTTTGTFGQMINTIKTRVGRLRSLL